jgi:hypothetical protein
VITTVPGCERYGEVDIVGIGGERLFQHRLCRRKAVSRRSQNGVRRLLDHDIRAARRHIAAVFIRFRGSVEQRADA